jgi:hypothetical protein
MARNPATARLNSLEALKHIPDDDVFDGRNQPRLTRRVFAPGSPMVRSTAGQFARSVAKALSHAPQTCFFESSGTLDSAAALWRWFTGLACPSGLSGGQIVDADAAETAHRADGRA